MSSLSAEICWAPPERLCRALVALARDGTHPRVQHRAIGLLAALRPEGAGALAALVEPAPGGGLPWLALDAARALAAHPGASLSAGQVQRVLAALGGAPRPSMAAPVLECARSAEAEAIAAAWLDALAPEARDEVLLSLSRASDRLWAAGVARQRAAVARTGRGPLGPRGCRAAARVRAPVRGRRERPRQPGSVVGGLHGGGVRARPLRERRGVDGAPARRRGGEGRWRRP